MGVFKLFLDDLEHIPDLNSWEGEAGLEWVGVFKLFLDDLEHIPDLKCIPGLECVLDNKNAFLILNVLLS